MVVSCVLVADCYYSAGWPANDIIEDQTFLIETVVDRNISDFMRFDLLEALPSGAYMSAVRVLHDPPPYKQGRPSKISHKYNRRRLHAYTQEK